MGVAMRRGEQYLASLRDGRAVFLDGARVDDVTKHPAFAPPIRRIAATWDLAAAADAQATTTFADPATGRRHSAMWLVPRSADDLAARRRVHRLWAEPSFGLMGRTPDHVACVLSAFAGWRQLFDRGGTRFGDNVVRFYERARDEELYVAYGIVPLQIDRSQPAHRQPEPFLYPGVVAERDGGIVIRGSQGITTSAVLADWLFISYITPLQAGDEAYALSFVTPVAASGIRIHPRRPYAQTATSVFDYPLSSRFDEVDATVVFDDVFVPWEQVFIYRDVGLVNAQFHESPSHTLANFQSLVRFTVKLEFMAGLALKLLEVHAGERKPEAQAALGGDIAALCATFDAIVQAAERNPLDSRERGPPAPAVRLRRHEPAAPAHRGHAPRHPRAGRRRLPAAPVLGGELHQPPDARGRRALHARGHGRRARAGEAAQAGVGLRRHRVRRPPAAVRDVLLRRPAGREHADVPGVRLAAGQGRGGPLPGRVLTRPDRRRQP